jgi:hypothetical protein
MLGANVDLTNAGAANNTISKKLASRISNNEFMA